MSCKISQSRGIKLHVCDQKLGTTRALPKAASFVKLSRNVNTRGRVPRLRAALIDKSTPSAADEEIWKNAQAVCFDVDCTILKNDSLDLLADFMGVGDQVAELTNQAMDGSMNLSEALERRLQILNCKPNDLKDFTKAHPPESRITPFAQELVTALLARGIEVYLISGGFRELILPLARLLKIPVKNVMANKMLWEVDDDTGLPTKLVGFDSKQAVSRNKGKPEAIRELRRKHPYQNVVMIGDGITDLEAVQETDAADLFIGYGGAVVRNLRTSVQGRGGIELTTFDLVTCLTSTHPVLAALYEPQKIGGVRLKLRAPVQEREAVKDEAHWYVYSHADLIAYLKRYTVAVIGSGAWACAAARMVAQNCEAWDPADEFVDEVKMWVYEEDIDGTPLTTVINDQHENVKYFPGIKLPDNLIASPNLEEVACNADVLVFCLPHQFVRSICRELKGKVREDAIAVSLTKGMRVRKDGPQLISQMITDYLRIDTCVLMGANIAKDIGKEELSECTIGYNRIENASLFRKLFETPYFYVTMVPDVAGVEMAGTLKNIVALACGFVDGLGYGPNSKAAVMREGLKEMQQLSKAIYPTVRDDTFLESCGVADLIATCYGGRNRLVAEAWAKAKLEGEDPLFSDLERDLLKGQKLQGVLTSDEVQDVLELRGWEKDYPLFTAVNRVINDYADVREIINYRKIAMRDLPSDGDDIFNPLATDSEPTNGKAPA